eukprot:11194189-Lingulodinium_polyedra.AAC.1
MRAGRSTALDGQACHLRSEVAAESSAPPRGQLLADASGLCARPLACDVASARSARAGRAPHRGEGRSGPAALPSTTSAASPASTSGASRTSVTPRRSSTWRR